MIEIAMTSIAILIFYFFWYFQIYGNLRLVLYGCSLIAILSTGIDLFQNNRTIVFKDYPTGIWSKLALIPYCLITAFIIAHNKESAISATITYTAFAMISFVITYISLQKKSINWLINILCVIVIFDCIWVIFNGVYFPGYGNVLGRNCNPNSLGVIMLLGIFSLAYKSVDKPQYSLLAMLLVLLPLYIIIGCGSRKCFISAIIFLSLWIVFLVFFAIRRYESTYGLAFMLLGIVTIYIAYRYLKRFYINTDLYGRMSQLKDVSDNSRISLYKEAFQLFFENPILGIGLDQFKNRSTLGAMSHSTYAEMLCDLGLVGSIIYSVSFISAIVISIKGFISKTNDNQFRLCLIIALMSSEFFLGVGQVFFFDIEHFIAWTIIYVILQLFVVDKRDRTLDNDRNYMKKSRYIK